MLLLHDCLLHMETIISKPYCNQNGHNISISYCRCNFNDYIEISYKILYAIFSNPKQFRAPLFMGIGLFFQLSLAL